MSGDTLTPRELASLRGVDYKTVVRWCRAGRLDAWRTPGGLWRISADEAASLSPAELAAVLGVHTRTVRRWMRERTIAARRFGDRRWRIPASEVNRLLRARNSPRGGTQGDAGKGID